MKYTPPTPNDLQVLREWLCLTQSEMADYVGVAGGQQWRKYTGGTNPRQMSFHMLFYVAAKQVLTDEEMQRVLDQMRAIGAHVEP